MMKNRQQQKDILFSLLIFCSAFAVNLLIQKIFTTQTLVPMIFVFGVFLISLKTHGYLYGITSAIVSVFAVNFAFTYAAPSIVTAEHRQHGKCAQQFNQKCPP